MLGQLTVLSEQIESDDFQTSDAGFIRLQRATRVILRGRMVRVRLDKTGREIELFESQPGPDGEPERVPWLRMTLNSEEAEAVAAALVRAAQELRTSKAASEDGAGHGE